MSLGCGWNFLHGTSQNLVHLALVDSSCSWMEQHLLVGSKKEQLLAVSHFLSSLPFVLHSSVWGKEGLSESWSIIFKVIKLQIFMGLMLMEWASLEYLHLSIFGFTRLDSKKIYVFHCPSVPGSKKSPPSFVGNDYYCESGCPDSCDYTSFHTADPDPQIAVQPFVRQSKGARPPLSLTPRRQLSNEVRRWS